MSILTRLSAKPRFLSIVLLVSGAVIALAVSARQAAVALPDAARRMLGAADPTPQQARQALIEMLEKKMKAGGTGTHFPLEELRRGERFELVDGTSHGERSWTFNCNLRKRTFSFLAFKSHGCSFHWVGEFVHSDGKWIAQNLHWDYVACSK